MAFVSLWWGYFHLFLGMSFFKQPSTSHCLLPLNLSKFFIFWMKYINMLQIWWSPGSPLTSDLHFHLRQVLTSFRSPALFLCKPILLMKPSYLQSSTICPVSAEVGHGYCSNAVWMNVRSILTCLAAGKIFSRTDLNHKVKEGWKKKEPVKENLWGNKLFIFFILWCISLNFIWHKSCKKKNK